MTIFDLFMCLFFIFTLVPISAFILNKNKIMTWYNKNCLNTVIVDPFHITVYASTSKLKYIKLLPFDLGYRYRTRLYPVFYFTDVTMVANVTAIDLHSIFDFDNKEMCIDAICEILLIEPYQLKFAANSDSIHIIVDFDAAMPADYKPKIKSPKEIPFFDIFCSAD